ncbi:hypothetical protein H5410_047281 [Solanum commersonii]|uniref:Uncharacterized protein n=1 Tax=Solanum commersonii TaxID=4109 RepID=A0A9J5XGT1_SOLCO|nr:hypothetical protein H5410_047281 [Solanum commersonii]
MDNMIERRSSQAPLKLHKTQDEGDRNPPLSSSPTTPARQKDTIVLSDETSAPHLFSLLPSLPSPLLFPSSSATPPSREPTQGQQSSEMQQQPTTGKPSGSSPNKRSDSGARRTTPSSLSDQQQHQRWR